MTRQQAGEEKTLTADLGADVPLQSAQALREELGERLLAVVLFGSRARGDAKPESDWDLLVIAEDLPDGPLERQTFLHRLLLARSDSVSLIARTRHEFESYVPSLYLDIALDARVLYDPTGYARERLAHLHRLIDEAGLYRERTPAGDMWRWKKQPRGRWVMTWEKIGESV